MSKLKYILLVAVLTLTVQTTAVSKTNFPRIEQPKVVQVAKKKSRCNSNACHRRVAVRLQNKRMRATVKPYRAWLRKVRACESGGNYRTNTGNGFSGAYQFMDSTWRSVGGSTSSAYLASPLEQDYRAVLLLLRSGSGQWPVCG